MLTYLLLYEFSALISIKCGQYMRPQIGVIKGLALLITFRQCLLGWIVGLFLEAALLMVPGLVQSTALLKV